MKLITGHAACTGRAHAVQAAGSGCDQQGTACAGPQGRPQSCARGGPSPTWEETLGHGGRVVSSSPHPHPTHRKFKVKQQVRQTGNKTAPRARRRRMQGPLGTSCSLLPRTLHFTWVERKPLVLLLAHGSPPRRPSSGESLPSCWPDVTFSLLGDALKAKYSAKGFSTLVEEERAPFNGHMSHQV